MLSKTNSDNLGYLLKTGNELKREGRLEEAAATYRRCIEINPVSAWSYHNLGEVLSRLGDEEEAIAAYNKAIELNPDSAWSLNNIGDLFAGQSLLDKAIKFYRLAINKNPDYYEFYNNLGEAFFRKGLLDKAARFYQKAIELNPKNLNGYYQLGNIFKEKKLLYRAICYYQKVLEDNQGYAEKLPILPIKLGDEFQVKLGEDNLEKKHKIAGSPIFYSENKTAMNPPITVDEKIHPNFLDDALKKNEAHPCFVLVIPNGRAWINDSWVHAIINSDEEILIKHVFRQPDLKNGSQLKSPPVLNINETVALLSARFAENNYCHWMFDLLPQFDLIRRSGININDIDKFAVSSCKLPFQKETLKSLGIPESKIIEISRHPHIKAKNLIAASVTRGTKWSCKFLRRELLPDGQIENKSERIYISRRNASYRRVVNEAEVMGYLQKFGFRDVTLESLSVAEQALLLAGAEIVVAPHGAGLSNLVFCREGTKIIEFISPDAVRNGYYEISQYCGLEYYYMIGEPAPEINMKISLDLLSKLLGFAGIC